MLHISSAQVQAPAHTSTILMDADALVTKFSARLMAAVSVPISTLLSVTLWVISAADR